MVLKYYLPVQEGRLENVQELPLRSASVKEWQAWLHQCETTADNWLRWTGFKWGRRDFSVLTQFNGIEGMNGLGEPEKLFSTTIWCDKELEDQLLILAEKDDRQEVTYHFPDKEKRWITVGADTLEGAYANHQRMSIFLEVALPKVRPPVGGTGSVIDPGNAYYCQLKLSSGEKAYYLSPANSPKIENFQPGKGHRR